MKKIAHLEKKIPSKYTNPEQPFIKKYSQLAKPPPMKRKSSNDSVTINKDENIFINLPESPINQTKNTTSSKWSALFQ